MIKEFSSVFGMAAALAVCTPVVAQSQPTPTPTPTPNTPRVDTSNITPRNYQIERLEFAKDLNMDVALDKPEAAVESYKRGLAISDCVTKSGEADLTAMVDGEFAKFGIFTRLMTGMRKGHSFCVKSDKPAIPFFVNAAMSERYLQSLEAGDQAGMAKAENMGQARYFFMGGKDDVSVFTIGRCVAALSPQLAMDVLKTEVGSEQEISALDRLYSETPLCGVKSTPGKIPSAFQRATISTALYEWHRIANTDT
ncbi:hypothetical protein [Altererythrobacter aquiaggeris]|uniref:hypothetical protein n=1 Tax=Aestuarierythrobacter aquiaggeris TaxID=1898396 RepID=UPI003015F917